MKAKLFMALTLLSLSTLAVISDAEFRELNRKQDKTPEEVAKWHEYISDTMARKNGGLIEKPNSAKGIIVVANSQTVIPEAIIKEAFKQFAISLKVKIDIRTVKNSDFTPETAMRTMDANAVISIRSDSTEPSFIVYPDYNYAVVNVAALNPDKTDADNLALRVKKDIVRALAYIGGAAASQRKESLTGVINDVKDLDAIKNELLMFDVLKRLQRQLPEMGIVPAIHATYLKACEEGWAPAPTNGYQKAIWDKVHAIPQSPMKIEFDPKKGR